jgi:aminoglycoside phosphotransferase (APT) family kinase protein
MNEQGLMRLDRERRVLDLIAAHCRFRAPRVLPTARIGWQLRDMVPGTTDPWALFRRTRADPLLAQKIGHTLGTMLAEQHTRLGGMDLSFLPRRVPWPAPLDELQDELKRVLASSPQVFDAVCRVLRRYSDQECGASYDPVLVHGDLGLHNIAIVPETDAVSGVFDYDGSAWADRNQDFRYLFFADPNGEERMLVAALRAYERETGVLLDCGRIQICNAACAIGFLAYRRNTPPDELSCGRTLAQDLEWVTQALRTVGEA